MIRPSVRGAWRALRVEGPRAVAARAADVLAEAWRQRSFEPAPSSWRPAAPIPVLTLAATPPIAHLGGLQAQLIARLAAEARVGPTALLYPTQHGWRLELQRERRIVAFAGVPPAPTELENPAFEIAVAQAAALIGAHTVLVDGLHGLPLTSLRRIARGGLRLVVSLHDFAAWCPRPHLMELPARRFCGGCRDIERCARCLSVTWTVDAELSTRRRSEAAALFVAADALVFPSDSLHRRYTELFPELPFARSHVIAPAVERGPEVFARRGGRLRHVALVGSVQAHKGALVFAEVARLAADLPVRFTIHGGGDPELLAQLRRIPNVRIGGTYRLGALSRRLHRDQIDLVLLLSIVPEAYSHTLDECIWAGVPVIAFDLGALADRVPTLGAGRLVSADAGAIGVVDMLRDMLRIGEVPVIAESAARALSTPARSAAAMRALIGTLGARDSGS